MGWFTEIGTAIGTSGAVNGFVDIAVKAAMVLVGALVVTRLLRRASASTRHQVWTVALISVLALPALTAALPAWQVPVLPASVGEIAAAPIAVAPHAPEAESGARPSAAPRAEPSATPSNAAAPRAELSGVPSNAPVPRAEPSATPSSSAAPRAVPGSRDLTSSPDQDRDGVSLIPASFSWGDAARLLIACWVVGVALLFTRLMFSSLSAWWVVRRATPVNDATILSQARAVQGDLGISGDVDIVQSDRISMPMAWGILRSTVLLPAESASWTHARRRVVLLHEMAHLKRRDCQTLLLARIVTALHWFNPLAWTATRRLQAERERACDDLVLSVGTRGSEYAQHLLEIARAMRAHTAPGWATVAMARPSELEGRLLAILDPSRNRRRATRVATVVGLVAMALLVFPLAALQPRAMAQQEQQAEKLEAKIKLQLEERLEYKLRSQVDIQTRIAVEVPIELQFAIDPNELGSDTEELAESWLARTRSSGQDEQESVNPRVMQAFLTALADEEPEIR